MNKFLDLKDINQSRLQNQLLEWFAAHARPLPWRETYEPYHVWLSEVMLQQTQMDRGVDYFKRWLSTLPNLTAVAMASEETVLKLWEGLGYYARVRNFQKAAQIVCRDYAGVIPSTFEELIKLPGIGKYTAGAILSIAFQKKYPVVDGNVERVFSRLFTIESPIKSPKGQKIVWNLAEKLLPTKASRPWNQALMELGALICKKSKPTCPLCPLATHCQAHQTGTTARHPVMGKRAQSIAVSFVAAVITHNGRIYTQKRLPDAMWGNLWEFPGGHLEKGESPTEGMLREVREETTFEVAIQRPLPTVTHSYTRYKATLYTYLCVLQSPPEPTLTAAQEYQWLSFEELDRLPFSAGHRKLIELIKQDTLHN